LKIEFLSLPLRSTYNGYWPLILLQVHCLAYSSETLQKSNSDMPESRTEDKNNQKVLDSKFAIFLWIVAVSSSLMD